MTEPALTTWKIRNGKGMNEAETFGSYLRTLRESRKVSLSQLSAAVGPSVTYLSDVELNKRAPLTQNRIILTQKALSLSMKEEMRLRFFSARRNGKMVVDVDDFDDDRLERLIYSLM